MMLTDHFALREFIRSDLAGWARLRPFERQLYEARLERVAIFLEKVRRTMGVPVVITSGWRSPLHNQAVGGSPTSDHMTGLAADIVAKGWHPVEVEAAVISTAVPFDQVILYPRHVHIGLGGRLRGQRLKGD